MILPEESQPMIRTVFHAMYGGHRKAGRLDLFRQPLVVMLQTVTVGREVSEIFDATLNFFGQLRKLICAIRRRFCANNASLDYVDGLVSCYQMHARFTCMLGSHLHCT